MYCMCVCFVERNVKAQKQTAQTVAGSSRVSFSVFTDTETAMSVWTEKRFGEIAQTLILGP